MDCHMGDLRTLTQKVLLICDLQSDLHGLLTAKLTVFLILFTEPIKEGEGRVGSATR